MDAGEDPGDDVTMKRPTTNGDTLATAVVAIGLLSIAGCGSPSRHQIATGDLVTTPTRDKTIELNPRLDVGGVGGTPPTSPTSPTAPIVDARSARGGVGSIRVTPGEPEDALFVVTDAQDSAPANAVVDQVMIDSVVGQINGRPVYASEFFEPMDARLSAQAKTLAPRQWIEMAQKEIRGRLHDLVRDELLLAEFESSLSIEQRSGLLYFVSQIRDNLVSQNRGSEELLASKLQEEEGLTIDEKVEAERRKAFIREQLRNKLGDKAYVPWRDVELQYRQDEQIYNPNPTAHLRMIQIASDDQEAIDRVAAALADGEPFEAVAERESLFARSRGGAYNVDLTGENYRTSRIFGPDELNDAAVELTEGEIAGPIEMDNGKAVWIKLESVEITGTSLYDAQLAIHEALRNKRLVEEEGKYFQGLINRSSLSPIQDMESRLLDIASTRYLIDPAQ